MTFTVVALFFKILLRLVLLPLLLLKWVVMGAAMLVVGPVLAVAALVAVVLCSIPLLPILALGAMVWLLVRAGRRSAVA